MTLFIEERKKQGKNRIRTLRFTDEQNQAIEDILTEDNIFFSTLFARMINKELKERACKPALTDNA